MISVLFFPSPISLFLCTWLCSCLLADAALTLVFGAVMFGERTCFESFELASLDILFFLGLWQNGYDWR